MSKTVDGVYKIIFSGPQAVEYEKEIVYVTERAVFRLTEKQGVLEEISPGIDIDKDILLKMEFSPIIASPLKQMDETLFGVGKLGLREEIFSFRLDSFSDVLMFSSLEHLLMYTKLK